MPEDKTEYKNKNQPEKPIFKFIKENGFTVIKAYENEKLIDSRIVRINKLGKIIVT